MSQNVKGVLMRNLQYLIFNVRTKILADFQIWISVPLIVTDLQNEESKNLTSPKIS